MKILAFKILFFIFTMIVTVEEAKSSTVINILHRETSYSLFQEAQPSAANAAWARGDYLSYTGNLLAGTADGLVTFLSAGTLPLLKGAITGATRAAAKGGGLFMKYQGNFVLNKNWKNWGNYLSKQGWSGKDIQQTLLKGQWSPHSGTNYLNPGNPMSIVTNPTTGKSLIIDNVTKEIIQLGKTGHKF